MEFIVQVEEARPATAERPSAGPVFRSMYSKDGLLEVPPGLESPWEFFRNSVEKNPNNRMLGKRQVNDLKEAGPYVWLTYQEVYDSAIKIGSAMRARNLNPGDRCGIYGYNCSEWVTAMEACNSQDIIYVPLYDTLGAQAVEFIINHAEVSLAFVQESKIGAILSCVPNCTQLKTIVSFGIISESDRQIAEENDVSCFSWEEFMNQGNPNTELPSKNRNAVCTIMYTSGTTGEPKGVIIKNEALMAEVLSVDNILDLTDRMVDKDDTYFSFLPLAHIYDQVLETYCFYKGASVGFWRGDVRFLLEDVQELKPTMFCGVPRIFNRIHSGTMSKVSAGGMLKKMLFDFAYNYKLSNLLKGLPQAEAAPFFDSLVFEKTKQTLGGRIRILLSGAAPLANHVEEFLRVTACSTLAQGYGLTESCGGCFASIGDVYPMLGTVGIPSTNIEARLESVPEMGYDALSDVPRGEICIRGNSLFSGYYKRDDLTKEVFIDGWFHTGDIGELQPNGSMKIIDRKKNIFKLSQGEYVAVEHLENVYSRCPMITQIWVYGNSQESFLVSVAVPDVKALETWAADNNVKGDFKSFCNDPKARKFILEELSITAQNNQLKGFEIVKAVHLEPQNFDIERDLVTPTMKLKRPQLLNYYKECINNLYTEAKSLKV